MAQPVFEEHPLENYLRQSGEGVEAMPGGMSDIQVHDEVTLDDGDDPGEDIMYMLPPQVVQCLELVQTLLSSSKLAASGREFAERFKYLVISSSLLSSSLSSPPSSRRRSFEPQIPGEIISLNDPDSDRRLYDSEPSNEGLGPSRSGHSPSPPSPPSPESYLSVILLCLSTLSLFSGSFLLAILFATTLYYFRTHNLDMAHKPDQMTPTLNTLDELTAASHVWDSAVHEAISVLEKDERSIFYGPTSPSSPSASIRVALHSSLHTTQTQSDNVRQLLAALTSPVEFSQLSEMYAPPSPIKAALTLNTNDRPLSFPPRQRTISAPSDKRMTWNGSYAALASHGSPTKQVLRKRENRRSDLSALLNPSGSHTSSMSAPTSPNTLEGVQEEDGFRDYDEESPVPPEERGEFGMTALGIQRRRRRAGRQSLGLLPSPSHTAPPTLRVTSNTPSISSSTRFTTMQKTRHPLSLSALHHALQGALASKRYAASHLLALRFDEQDDDSYWDDVRAVMALLTSTLADASARLIEALDLAEQQRLRDENPSPLLGETSEPNSPTALSPPRLRNRMSHIETARSFAPMPSQLSRFATHVDAISEALHDAHGHLEHCVAALREGKGAPLLDSDIFQGAPLAHPESLQDSPVLKAYERLRRELGIALRECERGREKLLDIVSPPGVPEDGDGPEDVDGEEEDVPLLGPDGGSDDSDKTDSLRVSHHRMNPSLDAVIVHRGGLTQDDATMHLLLSASTEQLPPPGVEQVFEADTGLSPSFTRERSKLTREERIRIAKARRERSSLGSSNTSGGGAGLGIGSSSDEEGRDRSSLDLDLRRERWGPGGDVVQELKDVIWKVGEKRRRMTESRSGGGAEAAQLVFAAPAPPVAEQPEETDENLAS